MIQRISHLALTCTLFLVSFAGDDDYIRWSLQSPGASPWHTLRYEVTRRAPATTAVHRRRLPGTEEGEHALGLLTPEESDALFARAASFDVLALESDPAKAHLPGLTFRCDALLSGKAHAFAVRDPASHPDARVRGLFNLIVAAVLERAGPIPFRNVFFPTDQRGWLNVESIPAAKVTIDDFDTRETTPLYAFEVKSGDRQVRLESLDGRLIRNYTVHVEPRGTTTLRVDLR